MSAALNMQQILPTHLFGSNRVTIFSHQAHYKHFEFYINGFFVLLYFENE